LLSVAKASRYGSKACRPLHCFVHIMWEALLSDQPRMKLRGLYRSKANTPTAKVRIIEAITNYRLPNFPEQPSKPFSSWKQWCSVLWKRNVNSSRSCSEHQNCRRFRWVSVEAVVCARIQGTLFRVLISCWNLC
jgi:hypothetical protein